MFLDFFSCVNPSPGISALVFPKESRIGQVGSTLVFSVPHLQYNYSNFKDWVPAVCICTAPEMTSFYPLRNLVKEVLVSPFFRWGN